ncbi:LysR substrate-binding domain-containing protein [Rheinheimera sp. 4Y26]|uniref:LysR substrate-binding domain-containing protein n=1 Tax=Rheinheimera sp. 4Y26 TaxID=2977811 RepID=UPI0021B143D9|nr:LysR substrate-binding domain-containing protein [Rheinheimera sp. 4Y26]MCT6699594.1 LysR substrate-binding domain-containing protein [Rheinheimera sp. 4Y26]
MIELKLLRTLQALQQTGSLQGAASRLFVTQSALSHQLKDAEQMMGASLFVRKSQPVQFSAQGKLLLELAATVLPQLDVAWQQLKSGQLPAQQLRLTVECHACVHWLLPALKAFRQQWPQVQLSLETDIQHHAIEAMLRDELDLVLTTDRRLEQQVSYQPLFELELFAFMAPEHCLAARQFVTAADLAKEKLLVYPIEPERQDLFRHFLQKTPFSGELRQVAQASQMLQLVAAGEGIAVLPGWLAEPFVSQGLIVVKKLGAHGLKRQMYLASQRHQHSLALKALYQQLRQYSPVSVSQTLAV